VWWFSWGASWINFILYLCWSEAFDGNCGLASDADDPNGRTAKAPTETETIGADFPVVPWHKPAFSAAYLKQGDFREALT
jgi:hypothetical protein